MQSFWTLAGLGVMAAIAMALWRSMSRARLDEIGVVSQQWLSEHRHSESHQDRG